MAFNETKKAYELFLNSDKENISSNISDANVEDYNYDFVIINDTIEQLDVSAKKFVEALKKQN